MNIKTIALFVVGLVLGIILITNLIPQVVADLLAQNTTATFIGYRQMLQLVPFLAVVSMVGGCLYGLFQQFRNRDQDSDE